MPAAGSCLCAENRELKSPGTLELLSYFHTWAESSGCHPEACRSFCPSPEQKPARSRAHHPTSCVSFLLAFSTAQTGEKGRRKNLSLLQDAAMGTPSPTTLAPRHLRIAAWEDCVGLARLRRAPRELLPDKGPGAAQARAPGRAKQNWTLLRARRGTLALNQLFYSLEALCAPSFSRRIRPPAAKTCDQERRKLERWAPAGRTILSLSHGCRESQGFGSRLPARADLQSGGAARGVSVLQPARTRKLPGSQS